MKPCMGGRRIQNARKEESQILTRQNRKRTEVSDATLQRSGREHHWLRFGDASEDSTGQAAEMPSRGQLQLVGRGSENLLYLIL